MHRVKVWGIALTCAIAVGVPARATADLAEIRQAGRLRVLVSADELPHMFSFEESGDPGLEKEMIQGFARSEGLQIEFVTIERFDQIIPSLLEGKGDVILGLIDTAARRERIAFSAEALPARHLAVTRAPEVVESLEQLRERRVGSISGSSWTAAALEEGVPPKNIVEYDGVESMLSALTAGGVEAVVMSVTDFSQAQRGDAALRPGVFVGKPSSAAWGIRKEDAQLRRALNEYIGGLLRSPGWGPLVLKYLSHDALRLMSSGKR